MTPQHLTVLLAHLGRCFEYPRGEFLDSQKDFCMPELLGFHKAMNTLNADEREELYTSTFDMSPACVPYISVYLFGEEDIRRNAFMAGLQARYEESGFSYSGDLPDHLSIILRFAATTNPKEIRELAEFCFLHPFKKMREALNLNNPYYLLIECAQNVLLQSFPGIKPAISPLEQMQQNGPVCPKEGCCNVASTNQEVPIEISIKAHNQANQFSFGQRRHGGTLSFERWRD